MCTDGGCHQQTMYCCKGEYFSPAISCDEACDPPEIVAINFVFKSVIFKAKRRNDEKTRIVSLRRFLQPYKCTYRGKEVCKKKKLLLVN